MERTKNGAISLRERKLARIVELLNGEYPMEIVDEMLPILETYRENDFYVPNDEDGLNYVLENVYHNDLYEFTYNVLSDYYQIDPYIRICDGQISSASLAMVRDDLLEYVTSEDFTNKVLNDAIDAIRDMEL